MSGLFASLNATSGTLSADSFALSVTSKNLANVNNANYTREYVNFGAQGQVQTPQGTLGLGIDAESVQQDASALLDQQVMREASLTSSDQSLQDWLQQAQAGLDQTLTPASSGTNGATSTTTGDGGLASALDTLMNDFSDLAADPTNSGEKATVVEDATTLASTINSIDQNLAQVQSDAGTQTSDDVSTANTLLGQIAQLNGQIATAEVGSPGSAVDLRDERETDLESLAAIIPITSTEQGNGSVTVTTPDTSGNAVALVLGISTLGTLNYASGVVTGGSSATALGLGGGSIQGAITASTGPIQDLRNNLDSLAQQLVTSVNAAYNPSAAAGGNFFDPAGTTASTIALAPGLTANTLVAGTGAAGDNSIATAVAALANTSFSTAGGDAIDGTFDSYYAQAVSTFGSAVSNATSNLTDQTNVQTMIQNQRSTYSGVNMDEEMSNLIQYQRAYEASSQVFSILNQLLGTTITELGSSN